MLLLDCVVVAAATTNVTTKNTTATTMTMTMKMIVCDVVAVGAVVDIGVVFLTQPSQWHRIYCSEKV